MPDRNVVLIGFMATGKTTVGRQLARRLNRPFFDTDSVIEKKLGLSIAEIFRRYGEKRFRSEEALVVRQLAKEKGAVIATGGGVVLNPHNISLLRQNGIIIALTAVPQVIWQRVKGKKDRPLLAVKSSNSDEEDILLRRIEDLLKTRAAAYAEADYVIDTSYLDHDEVVRVLLHYLAGQGIEAAEVNSAL